MALGKLSLKGRALRLLSGREHSIAELQRKLAPHEEEPGEVDRVLADLASKGFISEQRVAESVVHRRAGLLGAGRLRQELQAKGLSAELIQQTMAPLRNSEAARALAVWQRKFGSPPHDAAERARQARFLASRGFSGEVIHRVLSGTVETD